MRNQIRRLLPVLDLVKADERLLIRHSRPLEIRNRIWVPQYHIRRSGSVIHFIFFVIFILTQSSSLLCCKFIPETILFLDLISSWALLFRKFSSTFEVSLSRNGLFDRPSRKSVLIADKESCWNFES